MSYKIVVGGVIAPWSLNRGKYWSKLDVIYIVLKLISRAIEWIMSRPDPIRTLVRILDFKYRTPEKWGVPGARTLITFFECT